MLLRVRSSGGDPPSHHDHSEPAAKTRGSSTRSKTNSLTQSWQQTTSASDDVDRTPAANKFDFRNIGILSGALQSSPPQHDNNDSDGVPSQGQPLDSETRAIMQQHFGHDFSSVRIHTDARAAASAQSMDAMAYTVGNDIVFGSGSYQPQTFLGRALIAHELAHTIQQQRGSATESSNGGSLEQAADNAAFHIMLGQAVPHIEPASATPPIQFLKVTSGGFGRALEEFTNNFNIPNRAILLLRSSRTFMALARTLDQHYVSRSDSFQFWPEYTADDRIRSGNRGMPRSMIGKRELMVIKGGPSFEPLWSPDNPLSADLIELDSTDIPGFISELAHEATHAANFVRGGGAPAAQTIAAEVDSMIQEEVQTRQSEVTILGEIPDRNVQAAAALVGSRDPAVVERDVPPAFMLSYLELFFFSRRLRDAQAADGITNEEAVEIRERVDQAEKLGLIYPWGGQYGDVWSERQTARREWREFMQRHRPTDPDFEQRKERLLQDHARRFFRGLLTYRLLPAPLPVP